MHGGVIWEASQTGDVAAIAERLEDLKGVAKGAVPRVRKAKMLRLGEHALGSPDTFANVIEGQRATEALAA